MPSSPLKATKERLGPIDFLDFRDLDLVTAHQKLGETVKGQAHKILRQKLDRLNREQLDERIKLVRCCRQALEEKLHSLAIAGPIRQALHEYLACLSAWAAGAELGRFQDNLLQGWQLDGLPLSAGDLALFLQNDNVGCQTGVYREANGSVLLWHTEEDVEPEPGSRFDKLRLATFRVDGSSSPAEINAFIYPDLLPGPAYGWRSDHFVQAVDSLPLKPAANSYMLANIATWLSLRLGQAVEPEAIITALDPFFDGYALTVVQAKNTEVSATKMEFAGNQCLVSPLDSRPGSYLFQVNIFSEETAAVAQAYEDTERESRSALEQRIARTARFLKSLTPVESTPSCLVRLLASREGGEYAYANEDVKSYFMAKVSPGGLEVWLGSGPALEGDEVSRINVVNSSTLLNLPTGKR